MINAGDLKELLVTAGVPVVDVSVGHPDNKATWVVTFAPEATQAQRDQAAALIAAYTPPTPATLLDTLADQRMSEKALLATAQALWECIPAPTMTKAQLKARAKQIFKNGNGA